MAQRRATLTFQTLTIIRRDAVVNQTQACRPLAEVSATKKQTCCVFNSFIIRTALNVENSRKG